MVIHFVFGCRDTIKSFISAFYLNAASFIGVLVKDFAEIYVDGGRELKSAVVIKNRQGD